MNRIICIGNPLIVEDAAGHQVFQQLEKMELPLDVDVLDGGVAGLNLLGKLENMERVVFVDSVQGFGSPGDVVLLDPTAITATATSCFGHAAGLPYLLRTLPFALDSPTPQLHVVGIEPPATPQTIFSAARLAIELASPTQSFSIESPAGVSKMDPARPFSRGIS